MAIWNVFHTLKCLFFERFVSSVRLDHILPQTADSVPQACFLRTDPVSVQNNQSPSTATGLCLQQHANVSCAAVMCTGAPAVVQPVSPYSLISPPPWERANMLHACEIIPPPDVKRAEFVLADSSHLASCSQKLVEIVKIGYLN